MLLFELSSVPFNVRLLMINLDVARGLVFEVVQYSFIAIFLVVRLGVGLPASYFWWQDMLALLRSGAAHSVGVCVYYLCANALLNALNVYWAVAIVRKAMRPGKSARSKSEKQTL